MNTTKNLAPESDDAVAEETTPRETPTRSSSGGFRNSRWYGLLAVFGPWILGALAIVGIANTASPFVLLIFGTVLIYSISAIGLNVVMGQAGLVSIGNAALMAVGGYTTAILGQHDGWSTFPVPVLVSAVVGAAVGLLIAIPALRLKGIYLALATLALQFFVVFAGDRYQSHSGYLSGVPVSPIKIGDHFIVPGRDFILLLGVFLGLTILVVKALSRHAPGRMWTAISESELAATAIGVNAARWKLAAFVVSSAIISVAGSLFAYYNMIVSAEAFTIHFAVVFIIILILGGMGTTSGAIVGAVVVVSLPYVLTRLTGLLPEDGVGEWLSNNIFYVNNGLYGLLVLLVLLYMPQGLVPAVTAWFRRMRSRNDAPPAVPTQTGSAEKTDTGRPKRALPTGQAVLQVTDLDVRYETGARAVSELDLRVEDNSIVAVLGRNGAGKTSTLRAVSGFLGAEGVRLRGSIQLAGKEVLGSSPGRTAAEGLVLVPERDKVFPSLTVEEHLKVATKGDYGSILEKPYFHRLRERMDQPAGLLSGGERQLLALATASVLRPRLLMVDEFSLGLAPVMIQEVARVIKGLRDEGMTVLLVEQNAAAALELADYVYLMEGGAVVAEGPPEEMADHVTMSSEVAQ